MNRFQKMRKVCKGYLERIPPLLMQGFQWGADWLREKILDLTFLSFFLTMRKKEERNEKGRIRRC